MTEIMLWGSLDLPGQEVARLEALDDGWRLFGTAIFACQHHPSKLDYCRNLRCYLAHKIGQSEGCDWQSGYRCHRDGGHESQMAFGQN